MSNPFIVFGASGAIGGAMAQTIVESGKPVILQYHKNESGLPSVESVGKYSLDLRDSKAVESFVLELESQYDSISGFIFSVANLFDQKLTHNQKWESFQEQIDLQVKAFYNVSNALLPLMKKNELGSKVLVVGSEFTLGVAPLKITPYIIAKNALTEYAKLLSREWLKHKIRVHILAPGMLRSNLTSNMPDRYLEEVISKMPEKELTRLEDIQGLTKFLISDQANSIYGNVIQVSRGDRR